MKKNNKKQTIFCESTENGREYITAFDIKYVLHKLFASRRLRDPFPPVFMHFYIIHCTAHVAIYLKN